MGKRLARKEAGSWDKRRTKILTPSEAAALVFGVEVLGHPSHFIVL